MNDTRGQSNNNLMMTQFLLIYHHWKISLIDLTRKNKKIWNVTESTKVFTTYVTPLSYSRWPLELATKKNDIFYFFILLFSNLFFGYDITNLQLGEIFFFLKKKIKLKEQIRSVVNSNYETIALKKKINCILMIEIGLCNEITGLTYK